MLHLNPHGSKPQAVGQCFLRQLRQQAPFMFSEERFSGAIDSSLFRELCILMDPSCALCIRANEDLKPARSPLVVSREKIQRIMTANTEFKRRDSRTQLYREYMCIVSHSPVVCSAQNFSLQMRLGLTTSPFRRFRRYLFLSIVIVFLSHFSNSPSI